MRLEGIHHVAIICSDYPRSKSFYVDLLGLDVLDENYRADRKSWKLDLGLTDGSRIELFSFPDVPERPSRPEAAGLRHLAFKVPDVGRTAEELTALGVLVEEIRVDPFTGRSFTFFKDPDGLPIEIYEAAPPERD